MAAATGYETVRTVLAALRRRWRAMRLAEGVFAYVAALCAAALAAGILEGWVGPPTWLRWVLFGALACLAAGGLVWWVFRPALADRSDEELALDAERAYAADGAVENAFINAVRLAKDRWAPSRAMVAAALHEAAERVEPLDVRRVVPARRALRRLAATAVLGAGLAACAAAFPARLGNAFARIARPDKHIPKVGPIEITDLVPGEDSVLLSGDPLEVKATIRRTNLPEVPATLHYRFEGGKPRSLAMTADPSRERFEGVLRDVRVPLEYYLDIGGTETRLFRVSVVEKPAVTALRRRYRLPDYTAEPPREEEDSEGAIRVLAGTIVSLEVKTNKPIRSAFVRFEGGPAGETEDIVLLPGPDGRALALARDVRISQDGTYAVHLTDELGHENRDRATHVIRALPDPPPKVSIPQPGKDVVIAPGGSLDLVVRGADNYGVSRAELVAWREGAGEAWTFQEWPALGGEKNPSLLWRWTLPAEQFPAGQILRYQAKMWDNNTLSGPGMGLSPEYQVRIEDVQAVREKTEEKYRDWRLELQRLLERQKDLRREMDALNPPEGAEP